MTYTVLLPRPCACGCGEPAATDQRRNRVSKYRSGHNSHAGHPGSNAGKPMPDEQRAKISEAAKRQTNRAGGGPEVRSTEERFWQYVERDPRGGCWLWTGATNPKGYSQLGVGSTKDGSSGFVRGHRLSYEMLVAPIPEGLEIDHLCNVRECVNPEHLEPVTHAENMRRAKVRRLRRGAQ